MNETIGWWTDAVLSAVFGLFIVGCTVAILGRLLIRMFRDDA